MRRFYVVRSFVKTWRHFWQGNVSFQEHQENVRKNGDEQHQSLAWDVIQVSTGRSRSKIDAMFLFPCRHGRKVNLGRKTPRTHAGIRQFKILSELCANNFVDTKLWNQVNVQRRQNRKCASRRNVPGKTSSVRAESKAAMCSYWREYCQPVCVYDNLLGDERSLAKNSWKGWSKRIWKKSKGRSILMGSFFAFLPFLFRLLLMHRDFCLSPPPLTHTQEILIFKPKAARAKRLVWVTMLLSSLDSLSTKR